MARQKFGAAWVTVTRISSAIQGTGSVIVVTASTCCCRARLWRMCQTSTGGVSRVARVRNTAVPGTRGTLLQLRHESLDWDEAFVDAGGNGGSAAMPDPHDQIHGARAARDSFVKLVALAL